MFLLMILKNKVRNKKKKNFPGVVVETTQPMQNNAFIFEYFKLIFVKNIFSLFNPLKQRFYLCVVQ